MQTRVYNMSTKITLDAFESLLHCKMKARLRLSLQQGVKSHYEAMITEIRHQVRLKAIEKISSNYNADSIARALPVKRSALAAGAAFVLDAELINRAYAMHFDGLRRVDGSSALGDFHYVPVIFAEPRRIRKPQRLLLEVLALLLSTVQGKIPRTGVVYHGPDCKTTTVRFATHLKQAEGLRDEMARILVSETSPNLMLNNHCSICEFRQQCHTQAVQEDNLSLIRGIGEKEIKGYGRKGLFTLTQLAYTFRPRRNPKQPDGLSKQRNHALHAMAIRDRKVYVLGKPEIPLSPVRMYLDMEGNSEEGFIYLIGVIVCEGDREERFSFWADNKDQEVDIFKQLFAIVARYEDLVIFSYGSYEKAAIKRIRAHARRKKPVDKVLGALVNVVSVIYVHFYFPTYSNGLKEVGRFLGFTWSDGITSGIDSVAWRMRWENTREETCKSTLIEYNLEDCAALHRVTDFLCGACAETPVSSAARPDSSIEGIMPQVALVRDLDYPPYTQRLGRPNFAHPDFKFVNDRAHFKYQQLRVYVRTSKPLKKRLSRPAVDVNQKPQVSERVQITASKCPECGSANLISVLGPKQTAGVRMRRKRAFDLVITSSGLKRRVIECSAPVYQCVQCTHRFVSDKYDRVAKHFHGLMSWAMYQHISYQLSLRTLEELLREFFGLKIGKSEIHMFKLLMARYYQKTYRQLATKLFTGHVLHIDETEVKLKSGKGYVWTFANQEEVVYMYRPTRQGEFLKQTLKTFKGVLVSDFYVAYESLDCPQQKCLIHLMRDMNQALLDNPFDAELQSITQPFGGLLRSIVATVDEHGLKRRYLVKYKRRVSKLFREILSYKYHSEAALALRQRLIKNRERLFTFIQYDAVPWNNNAAENAIKQFAYYREGTVGVVSEAGLNDYLLLLSILQTCRYRGISFLKFLLSKQRDIDVFCAAKRKRRQHRSVELYPHGFTTSPHVRPERARTNSHRRERS